ncbi:hypothetical protein Hanom_Chr02g00173671 [Helianthus anomalus]
MVLVLYPNFVFDYLVPSFPKVHEWSGGLYFSTHLVPNFAKTKSHMDGPCGLHFVTHIVPNLDMHKPLDLLAKD